MKKKKQTNKNKWIYATLFFILFFAINIVYAKTSAKIGFCDYSGVRRTFKIIGIFIVLIKIIAPIILIGSATFSVFKVVMSGKTEDLKTSILQVVKQGIAGLIIFCLPGLLDFVFSLVEQYDDTGFTNCTTCLLDIDNCKIPNKDPEIYTD